MPKATKHEILAFSQEFEKCLENIGNNQLAINSASLRDLVSLNRDAAWGFTELYCRMAQSKPVYIMTAYIVALIYQIVFRDDSLEKMVVKRAKALNAIELIMQIKTS